MSDANDSDRQATATLWHIAFRSFATGEHHVPLSYIPLNYTYVRAASPELAKREIESWSPRYEFEFYSCERAPDWMQRS